MTEHSQTLQSEDFSGDSRCNLTEALMTFEAGTESGKYILKSEG